MVAALEPPPPEEVLAPACALPDSFDFLALPYEIRMCVYKYCLVSDTEISLDIGSNAYYVVNRSAEYPTIHDIFPDDLHPYLTVKVPPNFSYPSTTNPRVIFVPPAPSGFTDKSIGAQIIPLASVVELENLNYLQMLPESAKSPFDWCGGIYIGPIHPMGFSYLPPCSYTPFVSFNAKLLQTCKRVYAEALPVLYSKNQFVLHRNLGRHYLLSHLTGRPLEHITNLRLEVIFVEPMLDEGGSNSIWSTMLRRCTQLRKATLSFPDINLHSEINYFRAIDRIAASIADISKGTGEPEMIVKAILDGGGRMTPEAKYTLDMKKHPKMRVPRGVTIELMGGIRVSDFPALQKYSRKGWRFERRSPENECDIKAGSWVELAWIKNQA